MTLKTQSNLTGKKFSSFILLDSLGKDPLSRMAACSEYAVSVPNTSSFTEPLSGDGKFWIPIVSAKVERGKMQTELHKLAQQFAKEGEP